MKKNLQEFCVGCGLCESLGKAKCSVNDKGYMTPISGDEKWLMKTCPAGGSQTKSMDPTNVWGRAIEVFYGWSNNPEVRRNASSGGIISEIAVFLLQEKKVDGIIHVESNKQNVTETKTVISCTPEEVYSRCGSRYSISHPLEIMNKLDFHKRYAFIGKPCDVTALKNFLRDNGQYRKIIPYTLSFFCAGLPSKHAQKELLSKLECNECVSLRYRGDGWPGLTTAVAKDGSVHSMDYNSSWGKILGRDVMKMCRFCIDGIGEAADISCGDAWYLTAEGTPDFSEKEGRNVVFARTETGLAVLEKMKELGRIHLESKNCGELMSIQKYQYLRRITMKTKLSVLRLFFKPVPAYDRSLLNEFDKAADYNLKRNTAIGMVKRILKKKI